jgi:hypothetical protein
MKSSQWIVSATALVIVLAACESGSESRSYRSTAPNRFGYQGAQSAQTQFAATPTPTPTPPPEPTPQETAPSPTPETTTSTAPTRDIPYGTPVPGKAGFVTSPHAPYAGYGRPWIPQAPRSSAPYTNKIFLVP